jgi:hypothetical protein
MAAGYCVPTIASDSCGQPFQTTRNVTMANGVNIGTFSFTVPEGKRLLIEHLSMVAYVPTKSGQNVTGEVITETGGQRASHHLGAAVNVGPRPTATPTTDALLLSQPVRAYADPKTLVGFGVSRTVSTSGAVSLFVTLSGRYLSTCDE